jgi:hypothetical protein
MSAGSAPEDTADLAELGLRSAVFPIIVAAFQQGLLQLQSVSTVEGSILSGTITFLTLLPALSTILAIIIAYLIADFLGVAAYMFFSITFSLIINSNEFAVLVFGIGILFITAILFLERRLRQNTAGGRHPPPR